MNFFMRAKRKKEKIPDIILVLIDWENLLKYFPIGNDPKKARSITKAITKLLEILKTQGEIVLTIVFSPNHAIVSYDRFFHQQGFLVIRCPKINSKDTADEILISTTRKILPLMPSITHICLGSGDAGFTDLLKEIESKEIKISIATKDINSLAKKIIPFAKGSVYDLSSFLEE